MALKIPFSARWLVKAAVGTGLTMLASAQIMASEPESDMAYRSALYSFDIGEYHQAQRQLLAIEDTSATHYKLLQAKVFTELGRLDEAEALFDELQSTASSEYMNSRLYLPLAKLKYAKTDCPAAVSALNKTKSLSLDLDAHARFIRASCTVKGETDIQAFVDAELILEEGIALLDDERPSYSIWYAYAYYNLALASQYADNLVNADRFFLRAVDFTRSTAEGRGLYEQIMLSRAKMNYGNNRFDYAMKSYAELPLDGYWADESLLGYGWSAFRNYKVDMALEAWRQLVNLPYKSVSVYEGLIAIPFALEKGSANYDALLGYETAIEEYDLAIKQIKQLKKKLTLTMISDHALQLVRNDARGGEPLHPVLARAFVSPEFRGLVEQIGLVAGYKSDLLATKGDLQMMQKYLKEKAKSKKAEAKKRAQMAKDLSVAIEKYSMQIDSKVDAYIARAMQESFAKAELQAMHEELKRLKSFLGQSGSAGKKQEMMLKVAKHRLQLVRKIVAEDEDNETRVADFLPLVEALVWNLERFDEYQKLSTATYSSSVTVKDISVQIKAIDALVKKINKTLKTLQAELLDQTQDALDEYLVILQDFKNQAKISAANLMEDFYQQGGRRLW